jgi:outer membrane protein OmpA-like peptidoglycan-associated protein
MNNLKSLSAYALVFVSVSLSAQDATLSTSENEKIILYNSQPVKVELAGDKIKYFIGDAPGSYMKGYKLEKALKIKPAIIATTEKVEQNEEMVNGNYAIISSEKVLLNYKAGFATLDKAMINKLNEISVYLKSDTGAKVLLTSHHISDNAMGSKLAENRLRAAVSYLKIKGISIDRIKTDTQKRSGLKDVIAVNYLK